MHPASLLPPQDHPKYAVPHQMVVMDCLDDPDETIQRKVRLLRTTYLHSNYNSISTPYRLWTCYSVSPTRKM